MTKNLHQPSAMREIQTNRQRGKNNQQRPYAGDWIHPLNDADCPPTPYTIGPYGIEYEWTPCLLNDWIQVEDPLEPFAFRRHFDNSLEFKGHLDASAGAVSGTVAFRLPGSNEDEPNYLLDNDQFFITVVTDDAGASFQTAMVFIQSAAAAAPNPGGDVTITWPAS